MTAKVCDVMGPTRGGHCTFIRRLADLPLKIMEDNVSMIKHTIAPTVT